MSTNEYKIRIASNVINLVLVIRRMLVTYNTTMQYLSIYLILSHSQYEQSNMLIQLISLKFSPEYKTFLTSFQFSFLIGQSLSRSVVYEAIGEAELTPLLC